MPNVRGKCVDAGSEYCPCYLAETNECITCSYLQGKEICDCTWSGICIYQEFFWCGSKRKSEREVTKGYIIGKKVITNDVVILKIKVGEALSKKLKHPGSYVFIRDPEKPHFFDVPMSIMDSDDSKGEIDIAIQIVGAKTKSIMECNEEILVKGPYWNGVLGHKELKGTKNENVLLISRGMSLAPSVLAIKYLMNNENQITIVMDPGKIGTVFIEEYIKDLDMEKVQVNLKTEEGYKKFKMILNSKKFSLIYSAGSDNLHKIMANEIQQVNQNIKLVITNNSKMCCGEGICGACSCKTSNGDEVKMCKTQLKAKEAVVGGEIHG